MVYSDWSSDVIGCYADQAAHDLQYWYPPSSNPLLTQQLCRSACESLVIIHFSFIHNFHEVQTEVFVALLVCKWSIYFDRNGIILFVV